MLRLHKLLEPDTLIVTFLDSYLQNTYDTILTSFADAKAQIQTLTDRIKAQDGQIEALKTYAEIREMEVAKLREEVNVAHDVEFLHMCDRERREKEVRQVLVSRFFHSLCKETQHEQIEALKAHAANLEVDVAIQDGKINGLQAHAWNLEENVALQDQLIKALRAHIANLEEDIARQNAQYKALQIRKKKVFHSRARVKTFSNNDYFLSV